jgi:hypothetical protein
LLIKIKTKTQNKFIISERPYIEITDTTNGFRSTLASCEEVTQIGDVTVRAEGQPAILGQVTRCGEVVVLGNIAFLGMVPAVIITTIHWCHCWSCWCCPHVACALQPAFL